MSSFWLIACIYLLVAAASLLEADVRPVEGLDAGPFIVCLAALLFAAMWPVRAVRSFLHRLGRS